jgi:ABC-type multidrug transport system fused ATPase/permease subunit
MQTDFLRYCRMVFWAAVPTTISWANFIIALITLIVGAAIWLVLAFGIIVDAAGLVAMLRSPEFFVILVVLVVIVRLFFAQYWIWKAERDARTEAESKVNKRETRKNIRIDLGGFHQEGRELMSRCENEIDDPPPIDDANSWAQKVENFLSDNLDESYISRFQDGSNILAVAVLPQPPKDHLKLLLWIRVRVINLNKFIRDLSGD